MNNLPKYWVVKRDATNPNWKKVIEYLNNISGVTAYEGGEFLYYGYDDNDDNDDYNGVNCWDDIPQFLNNPTELTIDEFIAMTEGEQFTRGEEVDVRDSDIEDWKPRIYLATVHGAMHPYVCVFKWNEDKFKNNELFGTTNWAQIRKIQPKTVLTRQEIADKFGVPVEQLEIKD